MRNRILGAITAFVLAMMTFSPVALAQRGSPPHDPHDLSGVWLQRGGERGGGPMSEWSKEPLPFTAAGLAKFNANRPGKGPRAVVPATGNDPLSDANVPGLLRTLVYARPFQLIPLSDKIVQIFEWDRIWREIWTDGRKVPDDPDPRFYGYSVGRWEGDTLVVETVGLDSRLWMDEWGTPFSDDLRVQERWRRVDRDNMELTLTITDPKTYTRPWLTDTKRFRLQPKGSPNGELLEVIFTPMDEKDFNQKIRDVSNGVTKTNSVK